MRYVLHASFTTAHEFNSFRGSGKDGQDSYLSGKDGHSHVCHPSRIHKQKQNFAQHFCLQTKVFTNKNIHKLSKYYLSFLPSFLPFFPFFLLFLFIPFPSLHPFLSFFPPSFTSFFLSFLPSLSSLTTCNNTLTFCVESLKMSFKQEQDTVAKIPSHHIPNIHVKIIPNPHKRNWI